MQSPPSITGFLEIVRRRLVRRSALLFGLYAATAVVVASLAAPLMAVANSPVWGPRIGELTAVLGVLVIAAAVYHGLVRPRRRWRTDRSVARYVGDHERPLASDLLSAVELTGPSEQPSRARFSPQLVAALVDQTAAALAELRPAVLVPHRELRPAGYAFAAAIFLAGGLWLTVPNPLRDGWSRLVTAPPPGPFGGAELSEEPLVGDLDIVVSPPAYTHRPEQLLQSTSGDFRALPGSTVQITTTALDPAPISAAYLVFGDQNGETRHPPVPLEVEGSTLRGKFTVTEAGVYRFLLEGPRGRHTEATPHHIELETDSPPKVELYTPGEDLDVSSMKRIELAYIAEDDHGIVKIELVTEDPSGGKPHLAPPAPGSSATSQPPSVRRKLIPVPEPGRRRAQGKFLWDLAELSLQPGVRVGYHLEVTDNDDVTGPNVGKSQVFHLRVFSPRERHEALIARQRELFEKTLSLLGGRLVVAAEDLRAHEVLGRDTADVIVEIGSIVAALSDDNLAPTELATALTEMRARIEKLSGEEAKLVIRMAKLQRQGESKEITARLAASDKGMVAELEDDVLLLADWIDRQRMENLLAITDEIKTHRQRLSELLDEYARTGSPAVRAEIDRELRALESKLAELDRSRGRMPEDVLDQFVNREAMETEPTRSCMDQVRALLDAGRADEAKQQMEKCSKQLDDTAQALEDSLSQLRGDRFSESERKLSELMDELADLAQDQKEIADKADEIWERYAQRADEMMRDKAKETRRSVGKTLDKLRQRLDHIPEDGLTPFSQEELDIVNKRLDDVDEMLADGDIAEALAMAKQARDSLGSIEAELDSVLEEYPRAPWTGSTTAAQREVRRAQPLADKLVDELEASTPSPRDIMGREDRSQLDRLRRRQQAVHERTKRLAKKAEQRAGDLPGTAGQEISQGTSEAGEQMQRAEKRMRVQDPSAARQEARSAAETLARTRRDAQGAARRQQGAGRDWHEPVRIPGADEYKPPEKFREDILEAMKRDSAPNGFAELVRRYYEELIR